MTSLDWLILALYFGLLLGLTWWSILKSRNTADDYFLAGRDLGWVVVGASDQLGRRAPPDCGGVRLLQRLTT